MIKHLHVVNALLVLAAPAAAQSRSESFSVTVPDSVSRRVQMICALPLPRTLPHTMPLPQTQARCTRVSTRQADIATQFKPGQLFQVFFLDSLHHIIHKDTVRIPLPRKRIS